MTFVISLVGYTPEPRFDGIPWTKAQIAYSVDGVKAYTIIDTITLPFPDPDPRAPAVRNITTALSPTATGFFLVTFLDAANNQQPTNPVQFPAATGGGAANPTVLSARYGVRHRIRDGVPLLDANPIPFNMVRLESLSDQIPAIPTPIQTMFQCRYADVPTQRYINVQVVPGTLVAFLDGSWVPTRPVLDVDTNGNFTLPFAPIATLLITYAWQYFNDGEIDQFVDEARQWLREFSSVPQIPDGLVPALISYASSRALYALQRSSILAPVRAGDSDIDWSKLSVAYGKAADQTLTVALREREEFYTMGPEAKDPFAVDVGAPFIPPFTPMR